jgi:ABC-2 type transport system ATP-binding protein
VSPDVVVSVDGFAKEYKTPFRRRRVQAVKGASFQVARGEIFGFVGPNGAGKTTTIRALMGLIRPTAGRLAIFGDPPGSRKARGRLGFLPESPYFYDYLSPRELCDLAGRLHGLGAAERARRAAELIERVGLSEAADRPLKKFSKGMLQRAGLAQALVNDPELVVLDEPMSGLDPLGRRDVRELIRELGAKGKTVLFSTHILSDVEAICDRVCVIVRGQIEDAGSVRELLDASLLGTEVVLRREGGAEEVTSLPATADVTAFLREQPAGVKVVSVTPRRESLEDRVLAKIKKREESAS